MDLPPAVRTYFDADKTSEIDALIEAFADDAVVKDEGRLHEGRDAIRAWWRAAKNKYHHVAEPIDATVTYSALKVRAKVTGDFPGSPATLMFRFTLVDGKIERLEIG